MGLFKSREEKAVQLFEKQYKDALPQIFSLATGQGAKPTERLLRNAHISAVRRALGFMAQRGYLGLNEEHFLEIYWPVALDRYRGKLEG